VGFSQEHSQVEVKFRKGRFHIAEDDLITFAAWQEREAVGFFFFFPKCACILAFMTCPHPAFLLLLPVTSSCFMCLEESRFRIPTRS